MTNEEKVEEWMERWFVHHYPNGNGTFFLDLTQAIYASPEAWEVWIKKYTTLGFLVVKSDKRETKRYSCYFTEKGLQEWAIAVRVRQALLNGRADPP